ncbi:hypothetical protein COY62_00255 [bacterium (Candidatus Howlettbacteria) CG_4_10_14_0_8_um_filter_40_9]|nr:MAG: hypothetical protein COY62_00255 [bacterium (Candidatus Howlettbacteria) CG_4_10_14_0_8_um_filter_40_9]
MFEGIKNLFKSKSSLALLGIILLSIFFRFFLLGTVPPGLYPDVAVNGMDAIHANETGDYKIFYPANNGREGLFMNMSAVVFKVFGTGLWQLRAAGALAGVLTVIGIYLLGKEIFDKRIGIFVALFMSTSFWAVGFSRIGFRAILVPFVLVWGSYFLFKAFKGNRFIYYILSGLVFGLGFHTYIAYKAAVLIFAVIFGYKIFLEKGYFKKSWLRIGVFGIGLVLLAFPILYYQQTHKGDAARTGQVSVFNPAVNKGNLVKTLAITSAKGLGMYNFYGDPNSRHNFKSLPALNPLVGIAFLFGLYVSFKFIFQNFKNRDDQFFGFLFLIIDFFVMMIPSVLTEEGMPHSLRAIGTMPFAFLFAGIGVDFLLKNKKFKVKNILIPLLGLIILVDFTLYFVVWAQSPETRGQFNESYVEASRYLNTQPKSEKKYVIINTGGVLVDGLPVAAQTYKFVTYGKSQVDFLTEDQAIATRFEKGSIVILAIKDEKLIRVLNLKCPGGGLYTYNPGEPMEFSAFKISQNESCIR